MTKTFRVTGTYQYPPKIVNDDPLIASLLGTSYDIEFDIECDTPEEALSRAKPMLARSAQGRPSIGRPRVREIKR